MKAPDGTAIVATVEVLAGTAGVFYDGPSWDYDGTGTQMDWDDQTTKVIAGQLVFADDNGKEWLESQLISDDAEPLQEIPPWFHDRDLRKMEITNTITALLGRISDTPVDVDECEFCQRAITLILNRTEPKNADNS